MPALNWMNDLLTPLSKLLGNNQEETGYLDIINGARPLCITTRPKFSHRLGTL